MTATALVPRADTSALYPPPFRFSDGETRGGFSSYVGVVGIAAVRSISGPTRPIVITGARPVHVDRGLEVVAVRVHFFGNGFSQFGYRQSGGYPLITCADGPLTGHGPTHPAEGAVAGPNDGVRFIVYVRALAPGHWRASGLHVDYVLPNGVHRSAETPEGTIDLKIYPRDALPEYSESGYARCDPEAGAGWTTAAPGYPP